MIDLKLLIDWRTKKKGDIITVNEKSAEFLLNSGYAEKLEDIRIFEEVKINEQSLPLKKPVLDEETNTFIEEDKMKKKINIQNKIKDLQCFTLPIDNYQDNAKKFYDVQPYFYDKSGIFWFWNYDESKYEIKDDTDVMLIFDKILGFKGQTVNTRFKNNTLEAMKRIGREKLPKPSKKKWVQFKDKAYSVFSGKVHEITPDYFFTNPIPWELGETDETPVMNKLFEDWVGSENVKLLYEIIAYCCYTDYPIHRIFCLVGSGSNGKSRYLALIEKFLGDNICASELDDLINNRFESFQLYRKLCCVMGETNFGVLSKTSLLKKLSGQDLIRFEKKGKDSFTEHNYAKILISSNSLPVSEDNTDGFYRRWTIINFPNQYPEGKDILETIPSIEYNNLAKKCVNILKGLLETGKFSNQGDINFRKEKYLLASNPLSIFIKTYCQTSIEYYSNYGELYTLYIKYLNEHKKRRIKSADFKKALEDEGLWVEKTSKKINDSWISGLWVEGIRISDFHANCDTISKPSHVHTGEYKNHSQLAQNEQKSMEEVVETQETINLPCHICGLTPSIRYDDKAQGKPICEFCSKAKEAQQ